LLHQANFYKLVRAKDHLKETPLLLEGKLISASVAQTNTLNNTE